jgi:MFS family permease
MIREYMQKVRLFSRNMRLCLLLVACFGFSFLGIYLVLLNLYLARLGFGPESIGLLWSVWGLVQALACLPAGFLTARIGPRRTIVAGVCLTILGFVSTPLAEAVPSRAQAAVAITANALTGLGYALWATPIGPFMVGATSDEERDHAFAVYFALVPLGAFFGSLVGGVLPGILASLMGVSLDGPAPYRYPLLLAGILALPALAAILAARESTPMETANATAAWKGRAPYGLMVMMALAVVLQAAASSAANTFFNFYLDTDLGTSTARIGLLASIGQLLSVPGPLLVPILAARWDRRHVVIGAALGSALSVVLLALVPHWAAAGVGYAGSAAFMMMWFCVVFPYSLSLVPARCQGTMSGAGNLATGLNSSIVSLAGGFIIAGLGFRSLFLISGAVTVLGVVIFWAYFHGRRGEAASA